MAAFSARHWLLRPALSGALLVFSARVVWTQTPQVILDRGAFDITRDGVAVGIETFTVSQLRNSQIRRTQGTLLVGEQRVFADLYTDTLGTPVAPNAITPAYTLNIAQGRRQVYHLEARPRPGRLSSQSVDSLTRDQRLHEDLLRPGNSIILDADFVHQLYWAAANGRTGPVMVIGPHSSRTTTDTVMARGLEAIQVGGHSVNATQYSIGSGPATRLFWLDRAGRLLRVDVPGQSVVALRQEAP